MKRERGKWADAIDAATEAQASLDPIRDRLGELYPAVPPDGGLAHALDRRLSSAARRKNALQVLNFAYYLCMISAFAWVAAQVFDRSLPVRIYDARLITDTVPQGGLVKFEVEFQSLRPYDLEINWNFKDMATNEVRRFDGRHVDVDAPTARHKDLFVYKLPETFPTGRACLRVSLSYYVAGNYLHRFFPVGFTYPDFCFTVTKP